ncbi:activating signal cointegrator 1 complex subunit 3 [Nematolebias whitei]|uniref:activating signal cointegrator 1 complex subunit 3 n=1 Tax=Nematolebias whitei TaxID=451745 RepID=UPI00189B30F4|nr:activating signal cointegrator 1 complex subunit 3 [Nematolebias whitei]
MEPENMQGKKVSGLEGRRELRKGNKVNSFGKTVNNREDGGVAVRRGKTGNKVEGDVRPGATRGWEGKQGASRRKWTNQKARKDVGAFTGPIEGLPELIATCNGRESVFFSMVNQEFHPTQLSQAWAFLNHLPVLEVHLSVKGWWEQSQEQMERTVPAAGTNLREDSSWLDVHADQEYVLQVSLRRLSMGQQRRQQDSKAQAPRFPKVKDEGWFLVLGELEHKELLAVKRVGPVRSHTAAAVAFYTPETTGK